MIEYQNENFIIQYFESKRYFAIKNSSYSGFQKHFKGASLYQKRTTEKTIVHCKVRLVGYVGNFSANLKSICHLNEMESEVAQIKQFLSNPSENYPGRYSKEIVPVDANCNEIQALACNRLSHAFEVIQGPPGTGKSTTIAAIIKQRILRSDKILVTTTRNGALESVVEKVEKIGRKILVFGNVKKLGVASKRNFIMLKVDKDRAVIVQKRTILNLKKRLEEVKGGVFATELERKGEIKILSEKISIEEETLKSIEKHVMAKLIAISEVYLTTIAGIGKIKIPKIETILMDEAGCTEEISISNVLRMKPNNVVFIGDHKQLPPLVFSEIGMSETMKKDGHRSGRSLMERFVDCGGRFTTLTTQYRMHKDIMRIVSHLFYEDKLEMGEIKRERSNGVLWRESNSLEQFVEEGKYFNMKEVANCVDIYKKERQFDPNQTIMIISFYCEQIIQLKKKMDIFDDPNLKVLSVDSSQGMEADCVVMSCVRNNLKGQIGFLDESKRLNVAISRAREVLYFVGDNKFFLSCSDKKWNFIGSNCVLMQ